MKALIIFFVSILLWYLFKDNNLNNEFENFENKKFNSKLSFPVYWINLDRSKDRKYLMEEQFKKFGITNHTRIPAVDGSNIEKSIINKNKMKINGMQN